MNLKHESKYDPYFLRYDGEILWMSFNNSKSINIQFIIMISFNCKFVILTSRSYDDYSLKANDFLSSLMKWNEYICVCSVFFWFLDCFCNFICCPFANLFVAILLMYLVLNVAYLPNLHSNHLYCKYVFILVVSCPYDYHLAFLNHEFLFNDCTSRSILNWINISNSWSPSDIIYDDCSTLSWSKSCCGDRFECCMFFIKIWYINDIYECWCHLSVLWWNPSASCV